MTLLDEYQALPGEPEPVNYNDSELRALLKASQGLVRREAIIRLLCRALDCAASDLERMEVATHDLRALLTAVERDFPKE